MLPGALAAILEGRTGTVRPAAFDFISTAAQIGDVRIFMPLVSERTIVQTRTAAWCARLVSSVAMTGSLS